MFGLLRFLLLRVVGGRFALALAALGLLRSLRGRRRSGGGGGFFTGSGYAGRRSLPSGRSASGGWGGFGRRSGGRGSSGGF